MKHGLYCLISLLVTRSEPRQLQLLCMLSTSSELVYPIYVILVQIMGYMG